MCGGRKSYYLGFEVEVSSKKPKGHKTFKRFGPRNSLSRVTYVVFTIYDSTNTPPSKDCIGLEIKPNFNKIFERWTSQQL